MSDKFPPLLWRVYRREWVTAYTSDSRGVDGVLEAREHVREEYGGKIRDEDFRISVPGPSPDSDVRVTAEVFIPNLQGEWKIREDADEQAGRLGPEAVVVGAGSTGERDLLAYGRKMMPA